MSKSTAPESGEKASPSPPAAFDPLSKPTAPFPWSVVVAGISALIAGSSLLVSIYSTRSATAGMKAGQRAYITYQVAVTNADVVVDSVARDKDFFMQYEVTVTNAGNTPAEAVTPKINILPDPDRPPLMIQFANDIPFDLGPKESRILAGQASFQHMHHARQAPGFSTGFTGEIGYKDVFGDIGKKAVCYQLVFTSALNGGFCGSVIQHLAIR